MSNEVETWRGIPVEEIKECLHQMALDMHPHIEGPNHTSRLIDKVYNDEPMSNQEIFDIGKYYSKMISKVGDDTLRLMSVLDLKSTVYLRK